jgi:hypothetical protein
VLTSCQVTGASLYAESQYAEGEEGYDDEGGYGEEGGREQVRPAGAGGEEAQ